VRPFLARSVFAKTLECRNTALIGDIGNIRRLDIEDAMPAF
jgi:hypothetical protein